jgi:multiple sugar transport system substrate-binding protein
MAMRFTGRVNILNLPSWASEVVARRLTMVVIVSIIFGLSACQQSMPRITPEPTTDASIRTPELTDLPPTATTSTAAPNETPPPARQINLEPGDLDGTIVHFWYPWSGESGQVIRSLVDEFNLKNEWGITVVPVAQKGLDGMNSALAVARQTDETPDLVVGYFHQLQDWDQALALVDLQPYLEDPLWGYTSEEQADFTPVFWEQDVVMDRRLGVPFQRSAQVLYYNTAWAQALGFNTPPGTPEQFRQQVCEAAWANRNDEGLDNDGTGGWIVSTNYATALSWIYSFGGDVTGSLVSVQEPYHFNSPQADEAFAFLRDLYDTNCAWLSENPYPEAEFARRLGLVSTGSVMDIPRQAQAFERAGNRDQWTIIPYPSAHQTSSMDGYGASLAVLPSTPEEQLAAWELARWLLEPGNHARFVQASGSFPVRGSELAHLEEYQKRYPQWKQALTLIPSIRSEPPVGSWGQVRWALSDAFTQLFRSYFSIDQIQTLLTYLDRTANDLHIGPKKSGVYDTPTPTPPPTITPTRTPVYSSTAAPTRTALPAPSTTQTP